jgi:hypothetical protein
MYNSRHAKCQLWSREIVGYQRVLRVPENTSQRIPARILNTSQRILEEYQEASESTRKHREYQRVLGSQNRYLEVPEYHHPDRISVSLYRSLSRQLKITPPIYVNIAREGITAPFLAYTSGIYMYNSSITNASLGAEKRRVPESTTEYQRIL